MGEPRRMTPRERVLARRASRPPVRSWMDTAKDFGSAAGESALGLAKGFGTLLKAGRGDPMANMEMAMGLQDVYDRYRQNSVMMRGGRAGLVAEQLTGIPVGQVMEEVDRGNYAKAAGRAAPGVALLGLGAKASMRPKPVPKPTPKPTLLLPEVSGPTAVGGGARFIQGSRGIADATVPNLLDVQAINPDFTPGRGTVLPQEVNALHRVPPGTAATYSGTGEPLPLRDLRSSAGIDPFRSLQNRAFEALVPERYKSQSNINPWEGSVVEQPAPVRAPATDPGVMPFDRTHWSNSPIFAGELPEAPAPTLTKLGAPRKVKGKRVAPTPETTPIVPEVVEPVAQAAPPPPPAKPAPRPKATFDRPYVSLADRDLETLAGMGDQKAVAELATRKEALGGFHIDEKGMAVDAPRSPLSILGDETGAVGPGADDLIKARRRQNPEFTAVGEEPPYTPPKFNDPVEPVYQKVLEQGGRGPRVPGLDDNVTSRTWEKDLVSLRRKREAAIKAGRPTRVLDNAITETEKLLQAALESEKNSPSRGPFDSLKNEKGSVLLPSLKKIDFDKPIDAGGGRGNIFHRTVNPTFDRNFENWVNARKATVVEGMLKSREFADLNKAGMEGIHAFQAGIKSGRFADVADYFNKKHQVMQETGVKLGFRENYLPQLWENSADEIFQVSKRLGLKPSFTLERVLENYQMGLEAGLKPKFKGIGELIGWYEQRANKAIADRQFFDHLRETKQIVPDGKQPQGWKIINPDHFPVQKFKTKRGEHVTKNYYAPKDIADAINNYLGEGHGAFTWLGDKASLTKNIILSAGIPKTGINAHGFNLAARHVMGRGLVRGGPEAIKWLVNPKNAGNWLSENLAKAPEFMKHGLTLTTEEHQIGSTGSTHLIREPKTAVGRIANKGLNAVLKAHGKLFEDPLFQNIVPAMKLKHAQGLVDDFLKQGMPREEALRAASKTTNELYGGINWEAMQRSRDLQSLLRGIVLAPDWLETQYRVGKGMVNTLRDPKNPRGLPWKRAAANLVGAYVMADVVNYAINGKHMWENEPGHSLDIKAGEVGGKIRYIRPFGTAADFARLPTDALTGALQGDLSTTSNILKNRRSTIARLGSNLLMNQDDFGKPIFGDDMYGRPQPVLTQIGKAGREVGEVATPQYLSGAIDYATGRAGSKEEAILGSIEMPVRYSRESTRAASRSRPKRRRPSRRQ